MTLGCVKAQHMGRKAGQDRKGASGPRCRLPRPLTVQLAHGDGLGVEHLHLHLVEQRALDALQVDRVKAWSATVPPVDAHTSARVLQFRERTGWSMPQTWQHAQAAASVGCWLDRLPVRPSTYLRVQVPQRSGQHAQRAALAAEGLAHQHQAVPHHHHLVQLRRLRRSSMWKHVQQ